MTQNLHSPRNFLATTVLLSLLASCGGSGGDTPPGDKDKTSHLPERITGIGTTGSMDGRWRITAAPLMPDPVALGNPEPPLAIGRILNIRNGQVVTDDAAATPTIPVVTEGIPHTVNWLVNDFTDGVLRFGVGLTFADNTLFSSGSLTLGAILGTTGTNTASGSLLFHLQMFGHKSPGVADIDQLGQWRIDLVRDNQSSSTTAPDFTFTDLSGVTQRLSDLRGKVVVLNFWFIDCPPCIAEMPALNNLVSRNAGENVVFLGLALDQAAALRSFVTKRQFDYRIVPDTRGVWTDYGVRAAPTHIVIDANGQITTTLTGTKLTQLEAAIDALTGGRGGRRGR